MFCAFSFNHTCSTCAAVCMSIYTLTHTLVHSYYRNGVFMWNWINIISTRMPEMFANRRAATTQLSSEEHRKNVCLSSVEQALASNDKGVCLATDTHTKQEHSFWAASIQNELMHWPSSFRAHQTNGINNKQKCVDCLHAHEMLRHHVHSLTANMCHRFTNNTRCAYMFGAGPAGHLNVVWLNFSVQQLWVTAIIFKKIAFHWCVSLLNSNNWWCVRCENSGISESDKERAGHKR